MGDQSGIEWTDATWNPTTGCDQVSPGCDNCYALTWAGRMKAMGQPAYQEDGDPRTSGPGFALQMHEDRLDQPIRWTKPRRIFVNSMSDLFHPDVTDFFIARVFAVMSMADRHTFQVLTKRHARMRSLVGSRTFVTTVDDLRGGEAGDFEWPLPNVWLGVSVEDQERADVRVPALLDTPAAVRFLSCEPLLGPVDIHPSRWCDGCPGDGISYSDCWARPDWVIVGGESGPHARPMHPDWARTLRDQCRTVGVPFFFKQWGAWNPVVYSTHDAQPDLWLWNDGTTLDADVDKYEFDRIHADQGRWPVASMVRVGKKAAGRVLDSATWDQFPADAGVPA